MNVLPHIDRIRAYCDYLEDHIRKVQISWKVLQKACAGMHPFYDDHLWSIIDGMITDHDMSKVSSAEFIPYQRNFFPARGPTWSPDVAEEFNAAWENHKKENPHHWENWTQIKESFPNELTCHCVCMICDWMAMGLAFGDTAESYYTKNATKINLPEWADTFVKEIFARLRA